MEADQLIVERVKKGDKPQFAKLIERHQKGLIRLALRMTRDFEMAEDIVQDSFIKAFKKIHLFEGRSSFKSWMYQITLNTARNKLRSRKRIMLDIDNFELATGGGADGHMAHLDISEILRKEVDKLPNKQRTALTLRIFEDLSFKEIAEIMECPYDTAKANYRHALLKLRHQFKDERLTNFIEPDDGMIMNRGRRLAEVE